MKKIIAILLCAVLTFALSAAAGAEHTIPTLDPPRILVYNGEDYMDIYIDGVDDAFFDAYAAEKVPERDPANGMSYSLDVTFGTEKYYIFTIYVNEYYLNEPYVSYVIYSSKRQLNTELWWHELTYYSKSDGNFTSGYKFRIYEKSIIDFISSQERVQYIDVYSAEIYNAIDDWNYSSQMLWRESEIGDPMRITFIDENGNDIQRRGSPDTGITDIAAVSGLALLAAGAVFTAKKRR